VRKRCAFPAHNLLERCEAEEKKPVVNGKPGRGGALFALSRTILSLVIDMLDTCRVQRGQDEATRQWAAVGLGICLLLTLLALGAFRRQGDWQSLVLALIWVGLGLSAACVIRHPSRVPLRRRHRR